MLDPKLIFVAIVWGVNFAVVKFALTEFTPLSFTIVRFLLAALFLLSLMAVRRESFALERGDAGALFRLGIIGITLYNIFFMEGLANTTASNSSLFISSSPLFAALLLARSTGAGIGRRIVSGLLLSAFGVFLVIHGRPGGLNFPPSPRELAGDLLTLCAAGLWALYTVRAKPLLEKYSPLKVTAYSMASGTLMLLPVAAYELFLQQSWRTISTGSWAALAFSAFISGGLGFTLWYQGVKRTGVSRTIAYHYLVPLVAVLFAALFLNERISAIQVLGGIAILFGVSVVQRKG